LLALFCATTKKNDDLLAFFAEIHSITGAKIDLALVNARADALGIGEVPQPYAIQSRRNLACGF
jgi:hypothetical protein